MVIDTNKNVLPIILDVVNYAETEDPYGDYEIELGIEAWNQILYESRNSYSEITIHSKYEKAMLLGKSVRINVVNPYIFKLWKCIV